MVHTCAFSGRQELPRPKPQPDREGLALRLSGAVAVLWGIFLLSWGPGPSGVGGGAHPGLPAGLGFWSILMGSGVVVAAGAPSQHWLTLFLAGAGKLLMGGIVLAAALNGSVSLLWLGACLGADTVWVVPIASTLVATARKSLGGSCSPRAGLSLAGALRYFRLDTGESLFDASLKGPLLVVFLRHFGCVFCREAMLDLAAVRTRIEHSGTRLVVVHMSGRQDGRQILDAYGLAGVESLSDPACELYTVFGLKQGGLGQLLGWRVLGRGLRLLARGVRSGKRMGDGLRRPGVFVLSQGQIVLAHRPRSVADRPDYLKLALAARQSSPQSSPGPIPAAGRPVV